MFCLVLLVASTVYYESEAMGLKGTTDDYDDYKGWVSCGCHEAPSCRHCGIQPHFCNGDCTWNGQGCSLIGNANTSEWTCIECHKGEMELVKMFSRLSVPFNQNTAVAAACIGNKITNCQSIMETFWKFVGSEAWHGFWPNLCDNGCASTSSNDSLPCNLCETQIKKAYDYIKNPVVVQDYIEAFRPDCLKIFNEEPDQSNCQTLVTKLMGNILTGFAKSTIWITAFCKKKMGCGGNTITTTTSKPIADGGSSSVWTCDHCSKGSFALLSKFAHPSQLENHSDLLAETICTTNNPLTDCSTRVRKFWSNYGKTLWYGLMPLICHDLNCSTSLVSVPNSKITCNACSSRINSQFDQINHSDMVAGFSPALKAKCNLIDIISDKTKCQQEIDSLFPSVLNALQGENRDWVDPFCKTEMDCTD